MPLPSLSFCREVLGRAEVVCFNTSFKNAGGSARASHLLLRLATTPAVKPHAADVPVLVVRAKGGDYTVHVVVGLDADGRMYRLDLWRRQAASDVWVGALRELTQMR